jgi:hypothetical protein
MSVAVLKGTFGFGLQAVSSTAAGTVGDSYPVSSINLAPNPVWAWWEGPGSIDVEYGVRLGEDSDYSIEGWMFPQSFGYVLSNAYGGISDASGTHTWTGAEWTTSGTSLQPWTIVGDFNNEGTAIILKLVGCVGNTLSVNWNNRDVTSFSLDGLARSVVDGASHAGMMPVTGTDYRPYVFNDWDWTVGFNNVTPDTTVYPKEASWSLDNGLQRYFDMGTDEASATNLTFGKRQHTFSMVVALNNETRTFWEEVWQSGTDKFFSVQAVASKTALAQATFSCNRLAITNSMFQEIAGSADRMELTIEGMAYNATTSWVLVDDVNTGIFGDGGGAQGS